MHRLKNIYFRPRRKHDKEEKKYLFEGRIHLFARLIEINKGKKIRKINMFENFVFLAAYVERTSNIYDFEDFKAIISED